jgi:hypothetical protein
MEKRRDIARDVMASSFHIRKPRIVKAKAQKNPHANFFELLLLINFDCRKNACVFPQSKFYTHEQSLTMKYIEFAVRPRALTTDLWTE